ncbi:protein-export chaperone SecB [Thiosocius teredinicola]|uniref:protein-export chaperone SecB n=1 Tax=Thiosocius teredinicola TaxID=1973002 RepID=UPI0009912FF8
MSDEQQAQRQFLVQRIYTKDISFEAPHSPAIFQENWTPEISVGLNSKVNEIAPGSLELVLKVTVEAKHQDKTVFLVEVAQAGLFLVQGFAAEELDALMGIAAPNVLFPYARELVSDLVTRGTFPQFVLQPVNFEAMYAQKRQAQAAQTSEKTENAH